MKLKGQISIELIFILVYLFLMLAIFFPVGEHFVETQSKVFIRDQETRIANSVSKILTTSTTLDDPNGTFTVEYLIPEIHMFGGVIELPCTVEVRASTITVIVDDPFSDVQIDKISSSIPFNMDSTPLSGGVGIDRPCGTIITVS